MNYIPRPLGARIVAAHSNVVVLEGARAVGKTMLAKKEIVPYGFEYVTLADDATYQLAKTDISSWVRNLPKPIIIDEAQRIETLPLAVKEVVDELGATYSSHGIPQFILTGSASLNRKGLDGQNPLTRRARNFELHPLTQREIHLTSGKSIVDLLWNAQPNLKYQSSMDAKEISVLLTKGGFPRYALNSTVSSSELSHLVKSDIDNTLGDALLPGEKIDIAIANAILKSLLALPGNILNVSRMASELGRDGRTIERYIDIFERRFLIRKLPNLALQAHKQTQSRPKVHPIDSSFSIEEFKQAGKDIFGDDRTLLGSVLESYVVSQIVPEAQWSSRLPDAFYWRQAGKHPKEVDLVLLNNNELIGIEVKAASNARPADFNGLNALSEDPRFIRGFLVYTGKKIIRHRDNIWAIPLEALWDNDAFENATKPPLSAAAITQTQTHAEEETSLTTVDASLFLSYRHSDNDYLDGAITQLAEEIAKSYEFLYGNKLDVFIDKKSIEWGQDWQRELDRRIESCNIIMPAVTPGYIKSEACRKELFAFNEKIALRQNCKIMPLIWQNTELMQDDGDMAVAIINRYQYEDVEDLRGANQKSPQYRNRIEALARRIHSSAVEVNAAAYGNSDVAAEHAGNSEEGLLEKLAECEKQMPVFTESFNGVAEKAKLLLKAFKEHPAPNNGQATDLVIWTTEIDACTKSDIEALRRDLGTARESWNIMLEALSSYVSVAILLAESTAKKEQLKDAYTMIISLGNNLNLPEDVKMASSLMSGLQLISPKLKPLSDSFIGVISFLNDVKASIDPLEQKLYSALAKED